MNALRAFSICVVLAACVFTALPSAAQDPGQNSPTPPVIQGPPGGPLALPPAPDGNAAQQSVLKFKMYALLGQKTANTGAALDPDLKPIESALKKLPYAEYQKISIDEREVPDGSATQFPINAAYTLVVEPKGNDPQGAAQLDIHVDFMQDDGKTLSALKTSASAKPGDALLMHGMPLSPGELVIALVNVPGDQQSQGGKSDQDQDQKDQQQQQDQSEQSKDQDQDKQQDEKKDEEKKKEEDKEKKEAQQAKQQETQPEQKDEEKKDEAEKKDNGSLESILQSLENIDRKEQEEVRNKRDRIDFKGDWW
mgnify:FL=1